MADLQWRPPWPTHETLPRCHQQLHAIITKHWLHKNKKNSEKTLHFHPVAVISPTIFQLDFCSGTNLWSVNSQSTHMTLSYCRQCLHTVTMKHWLCKKKGKKPLRIHWLFHSPFFNSIAIHGANLQTRKSQAIGKIRPCRCHLLTFT